MVEACGRMTAVHVSQPSNPTLTHRGNTVEKHAGLDHGSCAFTWQKMFVHLLWFAMVFSATKSDSQGFLRFSYVHISSQGFTSVTILNKLNEPSFSTYHWRLTMSCFLWETPWEPLPPKARASSISFKHLKFYKKNTKLKSKKSPTVTGPTERTPKPWYLIALVTFLSVRW